MASSGSWSKIVGEGALSMFGRKYLAWALGIAVLGQVAGGSGV
jgi:hypothetical protein